MDLGSILAFLGIYTIFYLFGTNVLNALLMDRYFTVMAFGCFELGIEIFLTFFVPVFIQKLRPEYENFSFIDITVRYVRERFL